LSLSASAQYLFSGTSTQLIYTLAGDGIEGYTGDGGPATQAQIGPSYGTAFDNHGNLYFSDTIHHVIRRVDSTTGKIHDSDSANHQLHSFVQPGNLRRNAAEHADKAANDRQYRNDHRHDGTTNKEFRDHW